MTLPMNEPGGRPVARKALVLALAAALNVAAMPVAGAADAASNRPHPEGSVSSLQLSAAHVAASGARPSGSGTYWPVFNCANDGEGSLRAAIAAAASGDTIEMIGLPCSTITLTSGITIAVDDLAIQGAGPDALTVTNGAKYGRVFTHEGAGTLQLRGLTISSGVVSPQSAEADSRGGCVFSNGSVALGNSLDPTAASEGVVVRDCVAVSTHADVRAQGGGIFAAGGVSLVHSVVSGCRSYAQDAATHAYGGGITVANDQPFAMKYSEVRDNTASGAIAIGGGVDAAFASVITVSHSTIAGNSAGDRAGGAYLGTGQGGDVNIDNSTISGNQSAGEAGLMINTQSAASPGSIHLSSVTVTANTSTGGYSALFVGGPATLDSDLVSGNVGGDLNLHASSVGGSDNLIGLYSGNPPQAGLIVSNDPGLGPLAANGGFARTHAVLAGSPAIDAGNDADGWQTDQRGYARTLGAGTDVGAYERDPDSVFTGGFE